MLLFYILLSALLYFTWDRNSHVLRRFPPGLFFPASDMGFSASGQHLLTLCWPYYATVMLFKNDTPWEGKYENHWFVFNFKCIILLILPYLLKNVSHSKFSLCVFYVFCICLSTLSIANITVPLQYWHHLQNLWGSDFEEEKSQSYFHLINMKLNSTRGEKKMQTHTHVSDSPSYNLSGDILL